MSTLDDVISDHSCSEAADKADSLNPFVSIQDFVIQRLESTYLRYLLADSGRSQHSDRL